MDQGHQPSPPPELKPWYYQDWFLFPVFVFWPVWAVLIIRSPWHNGLISGSIAWAMLIIGFYLIFWQQLVQSGRPSDLSITLVVPGLLLTVVTQALWFRDRQEVREKTRQSGPPAAANSSAKPDKPSGRQRARRRRSSRRGRSSRGR